MITRIVVPNDVEDPVAFASAQIAEHRSVIAKIESVIAQYKDHVELERKRRGNCNPSKAAERTMDLIFTRRRIIQAELEAWKAVQEYENAVKAGPWC